MFYEVVYQIEREAISLDARHADKRDYEFLNYIGLFLLIMKDIDTLYKGISYDNSQQRDHLYADSLREFCSRFATVLDRDSDGKQFAEFLDASENAPLLDFVDGLSATEKRQRWDRTIAIHLALVAFQDAFGHKRHRKTEGDFSLIVLRSNDIRVMAGLNQCVKVFDLHYTETGMKLSNAIEKAYRKRMGAFIR